MGSFFTEALNYLTSGFTAERLDFGDVSVTTTALLAEGGYSFVYSAKETSGRGRTFAAKKVLAQDAETREIAEMESHLLQDLRTHDGFVRCFGVMNRATRMQGQREYWMLLEYCPSSLIDLIYCKGEDGSYERRPPLAQQHLLQVFESVVSAVAHLHSLSPPVAHRDLKLENVLCRENGEYVLCDLGSATTRTLPADRSRRDAMAEEERIEKYSTMMYRAVSGPCALLMR